MNEETNAQYFHSLSFYLPPFLLSLLTLHHLSLPTQFYEPYSGTLLSHHDYFSKTILIISGVLKSVHPVSNV